MKLIAIEELLRAPGEAGPLRGLVRDAEELVQVLARGEEGPAGYRLIGTIGEGGSRPVVVPTSGGPISLDLAPDVPIPDEVESVRLTDALESRRAEILGSEALRARRVVLGGAGSVGSAIAVPLAQAGVGHFAVLDPQVIDAANLSRHTCGVADLGRAKAVALADALRQRGVEAEPLVADILELGEDVLTELVQDADLVIATTDQPAAQFLVNEACVQAQTPALFVGAYERARGGEVILVIPGASPCLYCTVGFRAGVTGAPAPAERRAAYQSADQNQLVAEPGLAADIGFLASVAAAYALSALNPGGSRGVLVERDRGFALVHGGSDPAEGTAELFEAPFEVLYARVTREEPCPVCGFVRHEAPEGS